MDMLLMLRATVPVFDADKVKVLLVPAVTLPNARLAPLRTKSPSWACWVAGFAALNP